MVGVALGSLGVMVPGVLTVLTVDTISAFAIPQLLGLIQVTIGVVALGLTISYFRRAVRGGVLVAAIWAASSLGGCAVVLPAAEKLASRAEKRGDRIADALRSYYAREGEYPDSLERLAPGDMDEVAGTGMRLLADDRFGYSASSRGYALHFHAPLFMLCERTDSRAWVCAD